MRELSDAPTDLLCGGHFWQVNQILKLRKIVKLNKVNLKCVISIITIQRNYAYSPHALQPFQVLRLNLTPLSMNEAQGIVS